MPSAQLKDLNLKLGELGEIIDFDNSVDKEKLLDISKQRVLKLPSIDVNKVYESNML